MQYGVDLVILAGTTEAAPKLLELDLEYGYIAEVELLFPAGQAGLVYVQVYHQSRQIFPLTPGEAFRGDDVQIRFRPHFPILEVPFAVMLRGWAPDTTFNHTVIVGVTMEIPPRVSVGGFTYVPLPEGM